MTITYSDPYKDAKFGKLKGEKCLNWFQIWFNEGKLYKIDDGYMLVAHSTGFHGVTHSFSEKRPPEKGLVELPIYAKDYEVRKSTGKKDDNGKWIYESFPQKASLFEMWLCKQIEDNPSFWLPENQHISGNISFVIDPQVQHLPEEQRASLFATSYQISTVPVTDNLPKWEVKKNNYRKGGYGNNGVSLEARLSFVKKDLIDTLAAGWADESCSVGMLVKQLLAEFPQDEAFIACYIDLLKAVSS